MPAIQPARLKREVARLVGSLPDSRAFVRALENVLERYADRTYRPGQSGDPAPLLPAYNVPKPVLRQIRHTLTAHLQQDPQLALQLADRLWEKPILETRRLAIHLLGMIPASDPAPILHRLQSWANPKEDAQLMDELFHTGLARLRQENRDTLLEQIEDWMDTPEPATQIQAIRALLPFVQNPNTDDLPGVFGLLSSRLAHFPAEALPYLLELIHALAKHSPHETAHFIRQALVVSEKPEISWLARNTLRLLPETSRERLRAALRSSTRSE